MTDANYISTFFGEDLLDKHNMKTWWEKLHSQCLTLHATFVVIIFGTSLVSQGVSCLPTAARYAGDLSDAEASFLSNYCSSESSFMLDTSSTQFLVVVYALIVLAYSNVWFNSSALINSLEIFSIAEEKFWKLEFPLKEIKTMATTPNLQNSENIRKVHGIVEVMWLSRDSKMAEATWIYFNRIWSVLFCLLMGGFGFGLLSFKKELGFSEVGVFSCSVSADSSYFMNGSSQFVCSYYSSQLDDMLLFVYAIFSLSHEFILFCGLVEMGKMSLVVFRLINAKDGTKNCMLFMRKMYIKSNPISCMPFANFIEFIFSDDVIDIMARHLSSAVGGRTQAEDGEEINGEGVTPDSGYVEVVANMKGGGFIFETFYEMFRKNRETDFEPAISRLAFRRWEDKWNKSADDFIHEITNAKHWKLLVLFMNAFETVKLIDKICTIDTYDLHQSELNSTGCSTGYSVLFYALHRDPGHVRFKSTAVKHILKRTAGGEDRPVYYGETCITAKEFIEKQYQEDLTFPPSLKMELLYLIKNEHQVCTTKAFTVVSTDGDGPRNIRPVLLPVPVRN